MYAVAEKGSTAGSNCSQDNGRLWLRKDGKPTPASDEAWEIDTRAEAAEQARLLGDNWTVVDLDDASSDPWHCYRVFMKDGYAGLYNAATPADAIAQAIAYATESIKGAAMSSRERRMATTVDTCVALS